MTQLTMDAIKEHRSDSGRQCNTSTPVETSVITLVEADAESSKTLCVKIGRVEFLVFVDHLSLCTLLILLVDGLHIVVTNLKEDHDR